MEQSQYVNKKLGRLGLSRRFLRQVIWNMDTRLKDLRVLTIWKFVVLSFWLLSAFSRDPITTLGLHSCLCFHNMPCSVHCTTFTRPIAPAPPRARYRLARAHVLAGFRLRPTRTRLRQTIAACLLHHNLSVKARKMLFIRNC